MNEHAYQRQLEQASIDAQIARLEAEITALRNRKFYIQSNQNYQGELNANHQSQSDWLKGRG